MCEFSSHMISFSLSLSRTLFAYVLGVRAFSSIVQKCKEILNSFQFHTVEFCFYTLFEKIFAGACLFSYMRSKNGNEYARMQQASKCANEWHET